MREMGINRKNKEVKEGCDTASQPSSRIYRYAVISRQSRCGRLRCYLLSFAFFEFFTKATAANAMMAAPTIRKM